MDTLFGMIQSGELTVYLARTMPIHRSLLAAHAQLRGLAGLNMAILRDGIVQLICLVANIRDNGGHTRPTPINDIIFDQRVRHQVFQPPQLDDSDEEMIDVEGDDNNNNENLPPPRQEQHDDNALQHSDSDETDYANFSDSDDDDTFDSGLDNDTLSGLSELEVTDEE